MEQNQIYVDTPPREIVERFGLDEEQNMILLGEKDPVCITVETQYKIRNRLEQDVDWDEIGDSGSVSIKQVYRDWIQTMEGVRVGVVYSPDRSAVGGDLRDDSRSCSMCSRRMLATNRYIKIIQKYSGHGKIRKFSFHKECKSVFLRQLSEVVDANTHVFLGDEI